MQKVLLGNEAIAYSLLKNNIEVISAYPGTPSSEVLESFSKFSKELNLNTYSKWAVNEKVAFEIGYGAAIAGKRSACAMKMVGLNVASDPLMSSAYIGNKAAFIIISADDPGFYSSQTEQDSRYFAKFARVPAFDPSSPKDAYELIDKAVEVSEKFEIPVIFRPVLRVCHGREVIKLEKISFKNTKCYFEKNPSRWAAIPRKPRLKQAYELLEKLEAIKDFNYKTLIEPRLKDLKNYKNIVVASGPSYGFVKEVIEKYNLNVDILKIDMPTPLPWEKLVKILKDYENVIVFEETYPLIEEYLLGLPNIKGKLNNYVFKVDEITHEKVKETFSKLNILKEKKSFIFENPFKIEERKPSLCPGCPHRSVFFAIKNVFPNAIYPSDIGCYTLGINQKAVDTVLCMGASIGISCGLSAAGENREIVATIGDSTFLHAGIPALIEAKTNKHKFILVILDNKTVAMTGLQPTPERKSNVSIPKIVEGLNLKCFVYNYDNNLDNLISFFKKVKKEYKKIDEPIVVVINQFCLSDKENVNLPGKFVYVEKEKCISCFRCIRDFGCPAFKVDKDNKVYVDPYFCTGCGVCLSPAVCPTGAIKERGK